MKNVWDPEGRARWYSESGVKDPELLKEGAGSNMATVTTDSLHVRTSSSLDAAVVGSLKKNEQVQILERSAVKVTIDGITASWYKIRRSSDGLEGWCFGGYPDVE
ncbi:MAG: SH3 domain-containing protein [Spirochaetales bacterium]|nr:SH3 domain-containing protein [Spirochaetales bacterium]